MTSTPPAHLPLALRERTGFQSEYPFESRWIDIGGRLLHYIDEGPRDPGKGVVLCVHGNPTWCFAWRHFVRDFSPHHRIIALDHMGCGMSEKPQKYNYCLATHIANLVELIDRLDLHDISLVVHDWGGAIGFGAASRRPDRFRKFVVCNTAAFRSPRIPFRIAVCRWPIFGTLALRGLNAFSSAAVTMATSRRGGLAPVARAGFLAPYDSWANRIAVQRFVQDIPMSPAHPSWNTLAEVEDSLVQWRGRPMLLAWGLKDWCFNVEFLAEWVRRFPAASTLTFESAGHYLFEDANPDLSQHVLRFLDSTP